MELRPKARLPYHWSQKDLPATARFFLMGATQPSAPFTLADCGSLAVTN